jgi:hypothetical protein
MLRGHGGGLGLAFARVRGAQAAAHGDGGGQPDAAESTPESGARGGYDGAKRRKGSKVHAAVDTLGHLLALHVAAANEQDRAQVEKPAREVQRITGDHVELALCRSGLQRRSRRERRSQARHSTGGSPAHTGQTWLRPAAAPLGGRAKLRLGCQLPQTGQRL